MNAVRPRRSLWTKPSLVAWSLGTVLLSPYLLAHKIRRYCKHRKIEEVNPERWLTTIAQAGSPPPVPGPKVVMVGASYGELVIMRQIADAVRQQRPHAAIGWTLRDAKTIEHTRESQPTWEVSHWPFDFLTPVGRYLHDVRPDVLILTERYRFPTLVIGAAHAGAQVVLVNGRLKRAWLDRWILRHVQTLLVRSEEEVAALRSVVGRQADLVATGDIKLELRRAELPADRAADLEAWLRLDEARPIVAAGSTDSLNEDRWVLAAFQKLRESTDARLLLAPRRLERRDELLATLESLGLSYRLRSATRPAHAPPGQEDVLILDTIGELSYAYRYSVAAYVGGSWDGMGHNVTEPVGWGVPVAYGMRRGHFETLQKLCERHGVGTRVAQEADLADFYLRFVSDPRERSSAAERSQALEAEQAGSFAKTVDAIVRAIDRAEARVPANALRLPSA